MTTEREKSSDGHTFSAARWLQSHNLRWPGSGGRRGGGVNAQAESNLVEVIDLVDGARSSATYVAAVGRRGIFLTNQHVVAPEPPDTRPLQLKFKEVERPCVVLPRPEGVKEDVALLTVDEDALKAFRDAGLKPARLNFSLRFDESIVLAGFAAGDRPHLINGALASIPQVVPVPQLGGEPCLRIDPSDSVELGMSGGAVYGCTLFRKQFRELLPMKWDVFAIICGKLTSDERLRMDETVEVFLGQGLSIPLGAFADAFPDTVGKLRLWWKTWRLAKILLALLVLALLVAASVWLAWGALRAAVPEPAPPTPPAPVLVEERPTPTSTDAALTVDAVVPKGAFADVSGGANLPDDSRLAVETTPAGTLLDDGSEVWTLGGEAVVKAHRWRAEGVRLRKPDRAGGEVKLRVVLAPEGRTNLAPAEIYSTPVNISVPEPRVWITHINGQPVGKDFEPVIRPETTVKVSGGAENLMSGDTIWVMIYGQAPGGMEDMWPRPEAETDGQAPYRGGSMTWTRQVYIDTPKDGWTTFNVKAGAGSRPFVGSERYFQDARGVTVTCKGGKR